MSSKTAPTSTTRRFRSARGRPKSVHCTADGPDLGTPELILKRACHATIEPIDLCLQRGLITEEQHRAALHLRWLHTIRYGAPGVTALDLSRGEGRELTPEEDLSWRRHREEEYTQAIQLLKTAGYDRILIPCIIYNEMPECLKKSHYEQALKNGGKQRLIHRDIAHLNEGLALLCQHWRPRKNPATIKKHLETAH